MTRSFTALLIAAALALGAVGCSDGDVIDPCLVNRFIWDDSFATDFLCRVPLLRHDEVEPLWDLLGGLTHR